MNFHLYGSLFCLSAYIVGSIPFGVVISRIFGTQDPRKSGSGNIGFTNTFHLSGKKIGILTLIGDMGKGCLVGGIAGTIFNDNLWGLIGLFAVIIGHIFPVFLRFQGGKGVATGIGGIIGIDFVLGVILVIIWIMAFGLWKYSSGGALIAFTFCPIIGWLMGKKIEFIVFSIILSGLIILKHKRNIQRLMDGTERRFNII